MKDWALAIIGTLFLAAGVVLLIKTQFIGVAVLLIVIGALLIVINMMAWWEATYPGTGVDYF